MLIADFLFLIVVGLVCSTYVLHVCLATPKFIRVTKSGDRDYYVALWGGAPFFFKEVRCIGNTSEEAVKNVLKELQEKEDRKKDKFQKRKYPVCLKDGKWVLDNRIQDPNIRVGV